MEVNNDCALTFHSLTCPRLVVTVEDCLSVLLNLLKNNASNQSYFREGSYIRRLVDFFELSSIGEKRWSAQKVTNVHLLLQASFQRSKTHLFDRTFDMFRRFEYLSRRPMPIKILLPVNAQ